MIEIEIWQQQWYKNRKSDAVAIMVFMLFDFSHVKILCLTNRTPVRVINFYYLYFEAIISISLDGL